MSGVLVRADKLGDRLIDRGEWLRKQGKRIKTMLADHTIDAVELTELGRAALDIVEQGDLVAGEGVEALDIAGDVLEAKQVLTIGRHCTPNDHLRRRDADIERMREQRKALPGDRPGQTGRAA